jgi:2-polyprenyl-3-methyl-5-hydroxy-6-metoxy-1,4-benzoquinol methylase
VGCNNGVFLAEAEKMGYDVTGLDFNRYAIEAGKQAFGLKKLYCCTLDEFSTNFPSERFDVITFFEILEHLEDPNKFIETIKGMLNPKGFIALSVPNRHMVVNSLGATDYPPHHLTKWSSKAIKTFLESHGLTIVAHRIKDVAAEDLATWLDYNYIRKIDYALRKRVKDMAIDRMEKKWQRGETNSLSLFLKIRKLQLKILSGFFIPWLIFKDTGQTGIRPLYSLQTQ